MSNHPAGTQRPRTPKEQEAARDMIKSGEYSADQWKAEEKLQKIHESECEECQHLKLWFGTTA